MKRFEIVEHTADIGIKAYGKDLKEAFANSAYAMFSLIIDLKRVKEEESFELELSSAERKELLVAFLSELLYNYEVKGFLGKRFEIEDLGKRKIKAKIFGEKLDSRRHKPRMEIKGVTYHQLEIEPFKEGWRVQVIFDI
jgi:SHS2 domain-containing protein